MTKRNIYSINISGKRARKTFVLFSLALLTVLLLCSCGFFTGKDTNWTPRVPVLLQKSDGIKVISDNPAMVPIGSDAVFELEIDESTVIDELPEGAVLEDGKLTLKSIFYPLTLNIKSHCRTLCDFSITTEESDMGSVTSTLKDGQYWSETEITLTATPEEGFFFLGFSIDKPVSQGGMLAWTESSYTFALSKSVRIYANFTKEWVDPATLVEVPEDKWVLLYHSNGGVVTETGNDDIKTVTFSNTYYLCPNAIQDRDFFERDGYILYGYNTKPDGTGTYYGPGWSVVMPERGAVSLFCMWAKVSDVSDFEYVLESDGTVSIERYNGSDEFVVIPETIEGRPVTTVADNAFLNNTEMKKVLINKNIRTLKDMAFVRCSALEEMYFTDAVTSVDDGLLYECPEFNKVYMLAQITPYYRRTRNGTYAIKYQRLITAKGKKLVIASGSNSAYGIDSPLLEELMKDSGEEYSVVNYGQNAVTSISFYLEVISKHTNEGDIVLLAPESEKHQFGYSEINTTLWQFFEGAYNAFSEVDIRHYENLFSSFATFNKARNQTRFDPDAYEYYTTDTVNFYGDYSLYKEGYSKDYANTVQDLIDKGGVGTWNYSPWVERIEEYADQLNRTIDMVSAKGGIVLISFASINKLVLNSDSQIAGGEEQRVYEAAIDQYWHGTRISSLSTYIMDTEFFYNSHYHLGTAGAKERTRLLAADILAFFSSKN